MVILSSVWESISCLKHRSIIWAVIVMEIAMSMVAIMEAWVWFMPGGCVPVSMVSCVWLMPSFMRVIVVTWVIVFGFDDVMLDSMWICCFNVMEKLIVRMLNVSSKLLSVVEFDIVRIVVSMMSSFMNIEMIEGTMMRITGC